jgi:hypothetical protein
MPHFKKEHIIELANRIVVFANDNLELINNLGIDINNEHDSTYVGMIIRQLSLNSDLSILIGNKKNKYLTSEHILLRCIIDDYIHMIYITNQDNSEDVLTNFNADAINKNYNKIKELAELNEEKLNGNYPFYPTYALLEETKEKMKNSPKRQQYFLDKDNFKFKSFKATGNLIRDLKDEDSNSHQLRRAYFIWRKYSDFVHYSNFTYEEESAIDPEKDETYAEFAEIISYSYFIVLSCLKHFEKKYNLTVIDSKGLAEYYKDTGHK